MSSRAPRQQPIGIASVGPLVAVWDSERYVSLIEDSSGSVAARHRLPLQPDSVCVGPNAAALWGLSDIVALVRSTGEPTQFQLGDGLQLVAGVAANASRFVAWITDGSVHVLDPVAERPTVHLDFFGAEPVAIGDGAIVSIAEDLVAVLVRPAAIDVRHISTGERPCMVSLEARIEGAALSGDELVAWTEGHVVRFGLVGDQLQERSRVAAAGVQGVVDAAGELWAWGSSGVASLETGRILSVQEPAVPPVGFAGGLARWNLHGVTIYRQGGREESLKADAMWVAGGMLLARTGQTYTVTGKDDSRTVAFQEEVTGFHYHDSIGYIVLHRSGVSFLEPLGSEQMLPVK